MSGRAAVAAARVSRNTAPSLATWSACCWVRQSAAHATIPNNSFNPVFRVEAGGGPAAVLGFKGTNGRTPSLYSGSSTTGISGTEYALNTDIFLGITMNAGAAQIIHGSKALQLSKATGTVNTTGTPDTFTLFGRSPSDASEWFEGTISNFRVWSGVVLSDAEFIAEAQSMYRARNTSIWAEWQLAGASLTDISGNSRNLTAGGTALVVDIDPPVRPQQYFHAA